MTSDQNKGISFISYNHLNLPLKIIFNDDQNTKISYLYNATGEKVSKTVTDGSVVTVTDYLDGFQYKNSVMQYFPHAEGFVRYTAPSVIGTKHYGDIYSYAYNYTDPLGTIRLT